MRDVLQYMEPGYRPPSRTHVAKLVRARHQQGLELAKSALSTGVSGVALTTDIWTSKATQAFATTTAHFIDDGWELQSLCLEFNHFPGSHTGVRIAEKLEECTSRFSLPDDKVVGVVHGQAANVELAGMFYVIFISVRLLAGHNLIPVALDNGY